MDITAARILVVDDEPDLQSLIRQRFRKQIKDGQYIFDFALNGKEAVQKFVEANGFDAVMTDINMPEMDGLTLLAKLKETQMQFKAIVVTAYSDLQNIRTAMNRGAFDFLTKPIDFSDLEVTLNKTISEYRVIYEGLQAAVKLDAALVEKERALISERFKQQFLSNMSHEIRTPLNAVIGITNLLISKDPKPEQQHYLKTMMHASNNLIGIINDILDLAKIEAGKISLEEIPFDLTEQLNGVIQTLKFKADEKKIGLELITAGNVPQYIKGDSVRLNQIITNLLSNAIKFTDKGSVKLSVSTGNIAGDRTTIVFRIIDSGIGIAPENIHKIFESFTQEKGDTTRKYGGTGLGLTITKQLIELHNGTIVVESTLGSGSTFIVSIPYAVSTADEIKVASSFDSGNYNLPDKINILLVEDQPFNQMVAIDTLESLFDNIKIDTADNGKIGLEKVQSGNYHLVLMDIQMPVMDGYTTAKEIRKLAEPYGKIPIMAMTANVIKEELDQCFESGMNDFIPKPFDPQQLKQKITVLVSQKKN